MTNLLRSTPLGFKIGGLLAALTLTAAGLQAQTPTARIRAEISAVATTPLPGTLHPLAQSRFDSGRMPGNTALHGISLVFSRSAAQQADLDALIAAQQDHNSPLYHQWLSPDQFAARFGMAQSDLDKVQTWLEQQGFSIDSVARSRNMIRFSGTAGQVEQAFSTQMHFYTVAGEKHFAPSTELSLPSALSPVVTAVRNLDDFRPRPMIQHSRIRQANPAFTSSISGSVFFTPGDIKLAYGVNTLISAGNTGAGQSIAIVGQSSIVTSDIENFQNADALTVKDPTLVLVPGSGTPQVYSGDEGESDLDLEWSGAMAPGAQIYFVYTGNSTNYGVFDSIAYAVDEKIGNIISVSYGSCEGGSSASSLLALDAVLQQATTQGQTVVAASGDAGSSSCYVSPTATSPVLATQEALSVSFPASSQYVTGVGGTEITSANDTAGSTYWQAKGSSDEITSLLQYIPEVAWNDDVTAVNAGATSLSATGGGVSTLYTAQPSWQSSYFTATGETNPNSKARLVPDVALYSSPDLPGYLFCTSDSSDWVNGQTASCSSGFRDSSTNDLTVAGGTSFATPIFAGMVAVLNQTKGYVSGQGLLNTELYSLASNSTTYAASFNDVTTGNNECPSSLGSSYCSTASSASYVTSTGYDPVTGLGSVNLSNLVTAWPASTSTLIGTTTTLSAASSTPASGASDVITVTVAPTSGSTTPTGTVTLSIDGCGSSYGATGCTPQSLTLGSSGTATYTATFTTAGVHTLVAQYAGDTTHAASSGTVAVTVPGGSSGKGTFSFAFSPSTLTVSRGSAGDEILTITPASGYTGTVSLNYTTSNNSALTNLCVSDSTGANSDGTVTLASATTSVNVTIVVDTKASDCVTAAVAKGKGLHRLIPVKTAQNNLPGPNPAPLGVAFAGLVLAGFLGRHSRKLRGLASIIALLALGFGLSACGGGGGGSSTSVSNPPKGTYTLTFTGTDTSTTTITATQSFTLTID